MTGLLQRRILGWITLFAAGALASSLCTFLLNGRGQQPFEMPQLDLHAMGSTSGETFAIATGPVDENSKGLFILDYLTGELQVWVPDYRTGRFYGAFKTNVAADLPVDRSKKPRYLLTTGGIQQRGATGNARPADSIAYVIDENTGAFAAYTFMWNRTAASAGQAQQGALTKLDVNTARTVAIPD